MPGPDPRRGAHGAARLVVQNRLTPMRSLLLKLAVALVVCVVPATLAGACGSGSGATRSASPSPSADAVVARVNGAEIRQSDVDLARAEARLVGADDRAARALRTAIDGVLVSAEAERLGLSADKAEVERRLAAVRDQLGGQTQLDAALKKTGMTVAQLRESLAQGVLREAVQNARFPDVVAGADAVRAFYRRNLEKLFTKGAAVELGAFVARNEGIAGNALKRLRQGRPFGEVAQQFSVDPELKASAGAMGWVATSSLPAPLRKAVDGLRVGEVSPPTPGPGGVWVFQLLARQAATVVPFAGARDQIQKGLDGELRSAALARWIAQARKDAQIERL
jgi:parvulin-like peptidyl-prolyl isomerase